MAFIEFETEEAYTEAINKAIEEKNQSWITGRLEGARNKAIEETKALYSDYDQLKESASKWAETEEGYKKKISEYESNKSKSEADSLKLKAALKYGIDIEDVDRIRGDNAEEIEKDAKSFADRHRRTFSAPLKAPESNEIDGIQAAFMKLNPNIKI